MAERYRQRVAPEQVQVGLPDSGGVDLAQQLARAGKSVQNLAVDVGTSLRREQGRQEGIAAGASGKPQPISGLGALTAYGQEYNSAAEAAYSAKVQTDIQTSLDRLAIDHEADPEGFQFAADSFGAAIHDSVPAAYRPQVAQLLKGEIAVNRTRLYGQQKLRQDNQIVADYFEGADSALRMAVRGASNLPGAEGDDYAVGFALENRRRLEVMAREGLIQPTDVIKHDAAFREALETGLINAVVTQEVERLTDVARVDVEAAAGLMEAVQNSDRFTPDQKDAIQKEFEAELSNIYSTRSRTNAEARAALSDRLAAGDSSQSIEAEARRLYREGAYSVDEYESARAARVRNAKEGAEKAVDLSAASAWLDSGARLDPTNPKHYGPMTDLFDARMAVTGTKPGTKEYFTAANEMFARTSIFPETARSSMMAFVASPDPIEATLGAITYTNARETNPTAWALRGSDPTTATRAFEIQRQVAGGVSPESAVARTDANLKASPEMTKRLTEEYATRKVGLSNDAVLVNAISANDEFNNSFLGFGDEPQVPKSLLVAFDSRVKTIFMLNGGNEDAARQQALKEITPLYKKMTINGKPEVIMHGIDPGKNEVVKQDIDATLDSVGYAGDKTKVKVVPSVLTDLSVGGGPPGTFWALLATDDDGNSIDVIRGTDNLPLAYGLPGSDRWQQIDKEVRSKALAEAEATRQKQDALRQSIGPETQEQMMQNPGAF